MSPHSFVRAVAALALLFTSAARAGAVDELKAGTHINLNVFTFQLAGTPSAVYTPGSRQVPKPAGTLAFDIIGTDLGLATTQSIHLTPTVAGDVVTWTFDKRLSPAVELGSSSQLVRVFGTLKARVQRLSGFDTPLCLQASSCPRDVRLQKVPGSTLTLQGTTMGIAWSHPVELEQLRGMGGRAVPPLSVTGLAVNTPLCSSATEDVHVPFGVALSGASPSGGTPVSLKTSAPQVTVPANILVPSGQQLAGLHATVKRGFTGAVQLSIGANGVVSQHAFTVLPAADCQRYRNPVGIAEYLPPALAGCTRCVTVLDHNTLGEGIASIRSVPSLLENGVVQPLAAKLGVQQATPVALSDLGSLTGTMVKTAGAAPVAFKAELRLGGPLTSLGSFTPTALNDEGLVVGFRTAAAGPVAVAHLRGKTTDLRLTAAWSKPTAVSDDGLVIAGVLGASAQQTSGFVLRGGRQTLLPSFGSATEPVAVTSRGLVAGNALDSRQVPMGVVVDPNGSVTQLVAPSGYAKLKVTAANENGFVVGTVTKSTGVTSGFLWTPQAGLTLLDRLVPAQSGLVVLEALEITDGNQVIAKGTKPGSQADHFLLSL